jgi:hypothetical protein
MSETVYMFLLNALAVNNLSWDQWVIRVIKYTMKEYAMHCLVGLNVIWVKKEAPPVARLNAVAVYNLAGSDLKRSQG